MNLRATEQIEKSCRETIDRQHKRLAGWQEVLASSREILADLERCGCELDYYGVSVSCTLFGSGEALTEAFRILRTSGWELDKDSARPEAHSASWQGFFRRPKYPTIIITFSSTVCKVVKVGTKMVEQPVYAVQCGETITPIRPEDEPVDDNIPF